MATIGLRDIQINARQESFRMNHYYLGVEHLFIGLLDIQGGLTTTLLEEQGWTAQYIVDAIRRLTGKGNRQRLWAGVPDTPRTKVVLNIANDLALENARTEIDERDLLLAILEENDSIPIRVLRKLEIDLERMKGDAHTRQITETPGQSYIKVDFGADFDVTDALSDETLFLLRRMFHGYSQIRVERRLTGGYTSALILVVTPIGADHMEDAAVVVKIDSADTVLDEAQRYEQHVKNSLPPLTARLEDKPTTSDTSDVAGLKYTFVAGKDNTAQDLRMVAQKIGVDKLGDWLRRELYPYFGKTWWQQRRAFRFQVWTEYDWLLPPLLTLDYLPDDTDAQPAFAIKDPIKRKRIAELEYGDVVTLEGFIVQRVYRDKNMIQLTLGKGSEAAKRAYKIQVRGLNLSRDAFYRGETVDRLIGRVWQMRAESLNQAVSVLDPDFDFHAESIPGVGDDFLPNPIRAYDDLLDRYVNGSFSKIHGDLHLGNILVGPNSSAFLIDFAQTRDGHTLFDWASLELSLLNDIVMGTAGESWVSARRVLKLIAGLNAGNKFETTPLGAAMQPIYALREIVRECLATPDQWDEYYIALAMTSLRAFTWDTMSVGGRRLMFLLAALTIDTLRHRLSRAGSLDTLSTDQPLTEE
ncbi:MAG: phosphotransferase [Anaerolinea sp.]|nr:phosphotransferase [Anaerolinea sp.]